LIRLSELTGNREYFTHAQKILTFFQEDLKNRGTSLTELLTAADLWLGARSEIVVAGKLRADPTQNILKSLRGNFLPRTVILVRDPETNAQELGQVASIVKAHDPIEGKVTVYLCEDFVCKSPITEYDAFLKAIKELQ
jgi:hypothetical protein